MTQSIEQKPQVVDRYEPVKQLAFEYLLNACLEADCAANGFKPHLAPDDLSQIVQQAICYTVESGQGRKPGVVAQGKIERFLGGVNAYFHKATNMD